MESEMKHDGMHKHHGHAHDHKTYWASWCSPVGLGIFALTASVAAAIVLHTLAALVGQAMFMHEARNMHDDRSNHMDAAPMMNAPAMDASGMVPMSR